VNGPAGSGTAAVAFCEICRDSRRKQHYVLVVEKEVDLQNIEGTGRYDGTYHVLGGTVNPLDSSAPSRLHVRELFSRLERRAADGRLELILGTSATTEGDTTALYLERTVAPLRAKFPGLTISRLGRGLTTGTELEYSDEATISSALENRK
jgi:recombination protein RecR